MNAIIAAISMALGIKRPDPVHIKAADKVCEEILVDLEKTPERKYSPRPSTPIPIPAPKKRPRIDRSYSFSMDRTNIPGERRIPYTGYHTEDEE